MIAAGYGFKKWFLPILTRVWCPETYSTPVTDLTKLHYWSVNHHNHPCVVITSGYSSCTNCVTQQSPITSTVFAYSIQKDHDFPFAVAILGSHWHSSNLAFRFARLDLRWSSRFGCTCSISRWHWRVAGFNRCTHGKVYWNSSRLQVLRSSDRGLCDNGPTRLTSYNTPWLRNPGYVLAGHLGAEAWPWCQQNGCKSGLTSRSWCIYTYIIYTKIMLYNRLAEALHLVHVPYPDIIIVFSCKVGNGRVIYILFCHKLEIHLKGEQRNLTVDSKVWTLQLNSIKAESLNSEERSSFVKLFYLSLSLSPEISM